MKHKKHSLAVAIPVTLAVTAGAIRIGMDYRAGAGFHPFSSARELQHNQVLFPNQKTAGQPESGSSSDSFWEQDTAQEDTESNGSGAGYLFNQEDLQAAGGQTAGVLTQNGSAGISGTSGSTAGTVYEITDRPGAADILLPGGGGTLPGGDTGENGGGTGENQGGGTSGGEQGGGTVTPPNDNTGGNGNNDNSGGGVTPDVPSNVPAMGGEVAGDPDEDTKNPPSGILGNKDTYDESKLPSDLSPSRIYVEKPFGSEVSGLYTGQTVNRTIIYNALDTYVLGSNNVAYIWGADALDTYITIDAVAFDSEEGPWYDLSEGQTLTIPTGAETMYLKVRYRFQKDAPWQELSPVPSYALEKSRVMILNTRLFDQEKVDPSWVLNQNSINQNKTPGTKFNLLYWNYYLIQQRRSGMTRMAQMSTRASSEPLDSLFPGWMENGKPVEWFYPVTPGRHVLEAQDNVPLDTEHYQAELQLFWMDEDYTVHASTEGKGQLSYLQTLTYCKGGTYDWNSGTYYFPRITVPEYIQAVSIPYSGISTDYLDLPASVLYVDTTGILNPLEYCLGLEVRKGYTVAAGNPHYTAKNGILYNLDQTEILGVPTETSTLQVGANVTRVVLPSQSQLSKLVLKAETLEDLPVINYENLSRTCRIVVPDALLDDYLRANSAELLARHLQVSAASAPETAYHIQDGLVLSAEGRVHLVLDQDVRWLSLPDSVTGLESGTLKGLDQLSLVFLPKSGASIALAPGCFDGTSASIICYTKAQYDAAVKIAPPGTKVQLLSAVGVNGYSYLETNGQIMLLSAPADIQRFDGTIPTENGTITVNAIGEGAFRNCDQLRWVTLPEQTTAIGYQAFQGCTALEGVLINTPESIFIGQEAFSECNSLRFVASNAKNGELKDDALSLDSSEANPYSFLYVPTENTGYNGNWTYFTEEDDVARYELVDCGGTMVLYGVSSAGERWIALRSGANADGPITLPEETELIYMHALEGLRSSTDDTLRVNWESLHNLTRIWKAAFSDSDLGGAVVLPEDIILDSEVFRHCTKLTEITVPSASFGVGVGSLTFSGCTALKKVTIGDVNYWNTLTSNAFSGCNALEEIVFTGGVPRLTLFGTSPFLFNESWSDEQEAAQLRLTVENPEQFLEQWRYAFAGYFGTSGMSAYQNMWYDVWSSLFDWETWTEPDNDEVFAEVDRQLLAAENRLRGLLGMDPVEQFQHTYSYTVDGDGMVTLTAARNVTTAYLTGEDLDMPYGWALDYIGAGAFTESPALRDIQIPETLAGICDGAFQGVQFDPEDDEILLLWINGSAVPKLIPAQEGVPFDFGLDVSRIRLIAFSYELENILRDWLYPMAGYADAEAMEAAVPDEEERMSLLLAAENRLRVLLDMDPIDSVDDMLGLTDRIEPEEPDLPDLPEWPDDFSTPSDPAPFPEEAEQPSETDTEPAETPEPSDTPELPENPEPSDVPEPSGDEESLQPDPADHPAPGVQEQEEETEA